VYVLELVGEDDALAAREAARTCGDVRPLAPGLATAARTDRVADLAFTRRADALVAAAPADVDAARDALADAAPAGEGSIAVRAVDLRGTTDVDTRRAERELGAVLVDCGFGVDLDDPDAVLRAAFSTPRADGAALAPGTPGEGVCAMGWVDAEARGGFAERAPTDRPFFQPGSMDARLGRALANLAGAAPGRRLLDPMCGTGGILIEAGLVGADVVGVDAQRKMVRGARRNLAADLDGGYETARGDATRLPLRDGAVEGVAVDAPYGRQSPVKGGRPLRELVEGVAGETRRVTEPRRAVLVGDRTWADACEAAGWTVAATFERYVHRSMTRYVHVLE